MKRTKLILAAFALFCMVQGASAKINENLSFVKSNGEVIPNGSEITVTDVEDDDVDIMIKLPVFVKNSSSAGAFFSISYDITEISNGKHKICGTGTCFLKDAKGSYETNYTGIAPGDLLDLQAEWLPDNDGICKIVYKIIPYENYAEPGEDPFLDVSEDEGASITVTYAYGSYASIKDINANDARTEYFDLSGRKIDAPSNGVFIKKSTNASGKSTTNKIVIK